jgi:hypothetical protein
MTEGPLAGPRVQLNFNFALDIVAPAARFVGRGEALRARKLPRPSMRD